MTISTKRKRAEIAADAWKAELAAHPAKLKELAAHPDYSAEYKRTRAAELTAAHRARLKELARDRYTAVQDLAAAIKAERQQAEQAREASFDSSRMAWHAREQAARLARATPAELEAARREVLDSGDPERLRAFRVVAAERAASLLHDADRNMRARANAFLNDLERETAADVPPEITAAREAEQEAAWQLANTRAEILQVGESWKHGTWLEQNEFSPILGEQDPNAGQVIMHDKSPAAAPESQ